MNGYRAWWRGAPFEASPDGSRIRLYADAATDGFEFVRSGRYRSVVPAADVERLEYVRQVATWRSAPFLLRFRAGASAELEYTGGNAAVALRLGCERVERGVYRVRVPADELTDVREDVVVLSGGTPDRNDGARSE